MDVIIETPISLARAAELLGKHQATLYRWSKTGVRGIVLGTLQVGGTRCTSREAIQRFCERLTSEPAQRTARSTSAAEKAAKELERHGV